MINTSQSQIIHNRINYLSALYILFKIKNIPRTISSIICIYLGEKCFTKYY
jgi:hypothetical protein